MIKNKEGKILVMPTPIEWGQEGKFDVPGGRINKDEFDMPFEKILRRELNEELGDDVKIDISRNPVAVSQCKVPFAYGSKANEDIPVLYVFYEGMYQGGDIKVDEDHTGYEWIDVADPSYSSKFLAGIYEGIKSTTICHV